jgi:FtsP/CotA-like multicopper oxidase with cupredoxin domain
MFMKTTFLALVLLVATGLLSALVVTAQAQTSGDPTVDITLYGGPVSSGASATYGFGYTADNITSPGPTITLHDGDTVTVTFHNTDTQLPHSFAVTTGKSDTAPVLFNSTTNPGTYVQPGATATVTFTVNDNVGNNYYICVVPGHVDLGMWGNCIIESAVPEFPAIEMVVLAVAGATVLIALRVAHTKKAAKK